MEELKRVKKQLVLDLDKNEAPAAWRWRVDCFVKFDDGQEQIMPREIPATPEEVRNHIGAAVLKQAKDIEADRADKEAKLAECDKLIAALTERADTAEAKLAKIAQANAQYDAHVAPLFAEPETRS